MKTPSLILVPVLLVVWAGFLRAVDPVPVESGNTVFKKDFSEEAPGRLASLPGILVWTGNPKGSMGEASIVAPPASLPDSPKAVLCITGNAETPKTLAPSINLDASLGSTGPKKQAVYRIRFLLPSAESYRADFFFGGTWDADAAILIFKDGAISAMQKIDKAYQVLKVQDYAPNAWIDLKVVFDFSNKTYSIFINGAPAANGLPWNNAGLAALEKLTLAVGFGVKETGTPVFYLHQVELSNE